MRALAVRLQHDAAVQARHLKLLWLAVVAVVFATPAQAQWVVGAYGGAAHTRPADVRVDGPAGEAAERFEDVAFDHRSLESPIYYGYRASRVVAPRHGLFIGGEFIHAKAYARPFAPRVRRLAMSHGLNFVFANIGLRRPVSSRIHVNSFAGVGPMVPHVEADIDGVERERYQLAGVGVQAALGAEMRLWRGLGVMAEYKWTRAGLRLDIDPGRVDLTPTSHHLAIGVSAVFRSPGETVAASGARRSP
jgi:hypothetical protein